MNNASFASSGRGLSAKQNSNKDAPSLRLYKVWKGNNIFACGGRLIFGPDARSLYLTICLITVPVILFCSLVSQTLVDHFPNNLGLLFVAFPAVFTIYILVLILLVSGRDPGIIPRSPPSADLDDEWDAASMVTDWTTGQSGRYLPPTKSLKVNGTIVRVKFCQTCLIYRPPRCSHCSVCNNCVDRFDHHCPWVGQCIGKRNYQHFFMFVSSTAFLCLYVFVMCWVDIIMIMKEKSCSIWEAFMESPASGILVTYTFTVSWFVGGLSAFHLYLIITNQTTYENFRNRYERRKNPYNHGCARNFKEVLFSKTPKSQHDFRAFVKPEWYTQYNSSKYFAYMLSTNYTKKSYDSYFTNTKKSYDTNFTKRSYDSQFSMDGNEFYMERCESHPMDYSSKWSNAPDMHRLASKFVEENVTRDREKIDEGL